MVAAVNVDVAKLDDIPAGNLQTVLSAVYGKTQWAAETVGEAKGTADFAAQKVGALHYHLTEIGKKVGYDVPPLDAM